MISRPRFPLLNNPYYLSLFLFCSLNQLVIQTEGSSNETDLVSLIAIKDRIQRGLSSWNKSFHFCQWQGITCSKRHAQRVIVLNISRQSLVGNLSPHIGNLSFLRTIFIQNNNFYGEIPQEIGHLFRLRRLSLYNNTFVGKIPVSLSQCSDMMFLDLSNNKLSGMIPPQLASLSNLDDLNLEKNNLIGEIPPSIGNLSSLQSLSLAGNTLDGSIPNSLGKLSSLTFLAIGNNRFSGEVPLSIYNISSINSLGINGNQFTGTLPQDIGITLPNLIILITARNQLSGSLPMSFANASKIEKLGLPDNNFTGQVPTNLGALKNLYWLNLGRNNLGRGEAGDDLSFITSLTNSSNLKTLDFTVNNFGGVLPNSISNLSTQIVHLYLGGNQISGIIPKGIGNLVNLIGLGLENNHIHGCIPPSIGNIQTLQKLHLTDNYLTGFIPSSLANITQLSILALSTNILEGGIPSNFGRLQHLQSLYLYENSLTGTIPRQIFDIPSLSILLDLSQNSLSGSLPQEVGNLQNLGTLNVSGNKLSGEIPSALGKCQSMEELNLGNNLFEGTIPESLSALKNIRYMDLSKNNLLGQIPQYLENFKYLQTLNLSFNKLEGEVPIEGIFKNKSSIAVSGNVKLCGGIQELKLPKCQSKETNKPGKPVSFKLAIALSLGLLFVLASCFLICYWKRKPKLKSSSSLMKEEHSRVSYRELFQATGGFAPTNIVGSGSFGCVYKGMLQQEETNVAVKVFYLQHVGASKSFVAECESLRNIRHRNLVKILTSCSSTDFEGNDFKALVFQFMPNGSLEKWLHRESDGSDAQSRKLNVHQRLSIAIDVASALNYLHHQCHVSVIHRDLKPSNVLLDDDMVAHVSDFGLAKLLSTSLENPYNSQSASIGVKGSIGYTAPEYGMGGEASIQGDMYSYGILLLEMFIGKRPTDEMFKDGLNIHNYASNALPDQVLQIVDPILLSEEDQTMRDTNRTRNQSERRTRLLECVTSIIKVGVSCSLETPSERMTDVCGELHLIRDKYLGTKK